MDNETFEHEIYLLSRKIKKFGYKPDMIIGILRGGYIPARYLSTALDVKEMSSISVVKDGDDRKVVGDPINDIYDIYGLEIEGLEILLVEDVLESGKSQITGKKYFKSNGAIVTTACLYIMPQTEIKPDFYLKEIKEVVEFPWETVSC